VVGMKNGETIEVPYAFPDDREERKVSTRARLREALSDMKALKEWATIGKDQPTGKPFMDAWSAALAEGLDAAMEYAKAWGSNA